MRVHATIRMGLGLCLLTLGLTNAPDALGQTTSSTGSSFSMQPMFVPMMTTNGQTTPLNPYMALSNPFYNPYGTGTANGMTNQQLGLMMLTSPLVTGGIGSGQISGSRPNPNANAKKTTQTLAMGGRDPSAVRRATQPAGSAGKYFSRQSPSQKSEPRGRFDRQARYFP